MYEECCGTCVLCVYNSMLGNYECDLDGILVYLLDLACDFYVRD